jgi:hypothetical protein
MKKLLFDKVRPLKKTCRTAARGDMAGEAPALHHNAAFPEMQEKIYCFFRGPKSISPWGKFLPAPPEDLP